MPANTFKTRNCDANSQRIAFDRHGVVVQMAALIAYPRHQQHTLIRDRKQVPDR